MRGFDDVKEASLTLGGQTLNVAVTSGMRNASKLLDQIENGEVQVDLWVLPQTPGERFLVCSDGLNSELDDAAIEDILATHPEPAPAAAALVEAAVARGGRDNVTAIVVNVEGTLQADADVETNPHGRKE